MNGARWRTTIAVGWWPALTALCACLFSAPPSVGSDDLTQPIRVSPNGHFLTQPDGRPFFWLGDWAWELFKNPTHDEADRYLKDRAGKGFTVILAPITVDSASLTRPNRSGELPFINRDPTLPNPQYFENVDWIVNRARHCGLRMALMPCWGHLITGDDGSPKVVTVDNAASYARWLAARYRGKGVFLWVLGGDTNPFWPYFPIDEKFGITFADYSRVYDELAAGILEGSGGSAFIN